MIITPTKEHAEARDIIVDTLRKYEHLSPPEMLAIAAQVVGQLVALQDQRTMTPAMAMEIVAKNIEMGNHSVIEQLIEGRAGEG